MPRVQEDYYHLMEQINRKFPNQELLTVRDVMDFTGYKSKDTVRRHYPFVNGRIMKVRLARLMCSQ